MPKEKIRYISEHKIGIYGCVTQENKKMFPTNTVGARIARPFIGFGVFVAEGHVLLRKGYEQVRVAAPTMNNNVLISTEQIDKLGFMGVLRRKINKCFLPTL